MHTAPAIFVYQLQRCSGHSLPPLSFQSRISKSRHEEKNWRISIIKTLMSSVPRLKRADGMQTEIEYTESSRRLYLHRLFPCLLSFDISQHELTVQPQL